MNDREEIALRILEAILKGPMSDWSNSITPKDLFLKFLVDDAFDMADRVISKRDEKENG